MHFKVFFVALVLLFSCIASAQQGRPFCFRVQDPYGAVVPGASATVLVDGASEQTYTADRNGEFAPAGSVGQSWAVTIRAQGFRMLRQHGTLIASDAAVTLTLHPAIHQAADFLPPIASPPSLEYGVQASGGVGLQDRSDFSFFNAGVHAGKVLTDNYGRGLLRANFEYGVEALPLWQSYTPKFQRLNCPANATTGAQCYGPTTTGGTYRGVSIVPIILRINFTHGARIMPWVQGAGGVLYTSRKYPGIGNLNVGDPTQTGPAADTSVWNFTPQGGIGMHYFLKPRRSLDFSVNAEHISSASLGDKNPGVNDSLHFAVGYSWWK